MGDEKKARAYLIDGHQGTRSGPIRNESEKDQLEKDRIILESHAISDNRETGVATPGDKHWTELPTDSAYDAHVDNVIEAQRQEQENRAREIQAQQQKLENEKRQRELKEKAERERRQRENARREIRETMDRIDRHMESRTDRDNDIDRERDERDRTG